MASTPYGSWTSYGSRSFTSPNAFEQSAVAALGAFADDFDSAAVCEEYREAIRTALPAGVTFAGDEFYGPYDRSELDLSGYPVDEHGLLDIKVIIEGVDFWNIVRKHRRAEPKAIDITPDWPSVMRWAQMVRRQSTPGSKTRFAAETILIECGVNLAELDAKDIATRKG